MSRIADLQEQFPAGTIVEILYGDDRGKNFVVKGISQEAGRKGMLNLSSPYYTHFVAPSQVKVVGKQTEETEEVVFYSVRAYFSGSSMRQTLTTADEADAIELRSIINARGENTHAEVIRTTKTVTTKTVQEIV